MLASLQDRNRRGRPIRVILVGAGAMGVGIALQIRMTPGMHLVAVTDIDSASALKACEVYGAPYEEIDEGQRPKNAEAVWLTKTPHYLATERDDFLADVLVESTNTISFAFNVCRAAIAKKMHIVLMNAEVDLALGPLLQWEASQAGIWMTSDAGDQHGVLARMIEEIKLWGFDIAMAGNIKGFLRRDATASSLIKEAEARHLNPIQCCAYTDGTKLNIEMAVIANGLGLRPHVRGMEGPEAKDVREVFDKFDFDRYQNGGVVDYLLGAEPGGGVFVVGHCRDELQAQYLDYYKLGEGPFYLFYRPYHLCHLETPRAIWTVAEHDKALLAPEHGRKTDVFSMAKRDLESGEEVRHAIGGDELYGLIDQQDIADVQGLVPIWLLEAEDNTKPRLRRTVAKDQAITWDDIEIPESGIVRAHDEQQKKTNS